MQRTRTKSIDPINSTLRKYYQPHNAAASLVDSRDFCIVSDSTVTTDVVTPGFLSRVKRGEIINNRYSSQRAVLVSGGGSYNMANSLGDRYWTDGGSLTAYTRLSESPTVPDTIASHNSKFYAALDEVKFNAIANMDKTPYEFMEDALSIKQTLGSLKDIAGKLANLSGTYVSVRNNLVASGRSRTAASGQAWNKYRFEYTPLVMSAMNLHESLYRNPTKLMRRTARSGRDVTTADRGSYSTTNYDWKHEHDLTSKIRAYIIYSTTNPIDSVPEFYGLRLKDVPVGLWNIVSLSFVVDRFLDISNGIKGFMNLMDPELTILAAGYSHHQVRNETWQVTGQHTAGWSGTCTGDTVRTTWTDKWREPWTPGFSDSIPSFRLDQSVTQVVDLLALSISRLKL